MISPHRLTAFMEGQSKETQDTLRFLAADLLRDFAPELTNEASDAAFENDGTLSIGSLKVEEIVVPQAGWPSENEVALFSSRMSDALRVESAAKAAMVSFGIIRLAASATGVSF